MNGISHVVEHLLVDFIYTTDHRFGQSAAPNHCIEVEIEVHVFEFVEHQLFAKVILAGGSVKLRQFFDRVGDGALYQWLGVFVHRHFG